MNNTSSNTICQKCGFGLLDLGSHKVCVSCPGGYMKKPETKTGSLRSLQILITKSSNK